MFGAFSAYLVAPLYDVPLLGLSLSAPLFMAIVIELLVGRQAISLRSVEIWVLWAAVFWCGLFASLAGNVFQGRLAELDLSDIQTLMRFAYWLLVFVMVTAISSRAEVMSRLGPVLAIAAIGLGVVHLATGTHFMTPNELGWCFSTFTPFCFALLVTADGHRKQWVTVGLGVLLTANVLNACRSSWFMVALGIFLFSTMVGLARPRLLTRLWPLVFLPAFVVAGVAMAPESILAYVEKRFNTFENLDSDKSFQIRLLMNQKGERLFKENPWFGAGAGRFKRTSTDLDLPPVLRYARQVHFDVKSAHNSYIALLAETGLAGMAPFAVLLAVLTIGGFWVALRQVARGEIWEAALWAGFVGMSIHFWSLSGLTGTAPWFVYGLVAGGITREAQLYARRRPS